MERKGRKEKERWKREKIGPQRMLKKRISGGRGSRRKVRTNK